MRLWNKRIALVLAILIGLTASVAFAQSEDEEYDPALVTFDGEPVLQSQIVDYAQRLYDAGYAENERDYDQAIEYILYEIFTAGRKISEYGLDRFTEAEEAAFLTDAQSELDSYYAQYVQVNAEEDATQEQLDALYTEAAEMYEQNGYTPEAIVEVRKNQESFDRLLKQMTIEISDEAIANEYARYVDAHKGYFENSIADYEAYTIQYGYESYYIPEGYRAVTQILLRFDGEAMTAYKAVAEAEGSTEEEIAQARETLLDTRKADIEDIYARLAAGEAFETLIGLYNADPGMSGDTLKTGYLVNKDSVVYDKSFVSAAFAENMQKPGDVSQPSVGAYGAYIVHYLRDVESGAAEMSEQTRSGIYDSLYNQGVYNQLVAWSGEYEIVYDDEALQALKAGV